MRPRTRTYDSYFTHILSILHLGLGEVYSEPKKLGDKIVNKIIVESPAVEIKKIEIKEDLPKIFNFEPKNGTENSIVRIRGYKLDELEYICFRDIKVKILKKNKRKVINKENNSYKIYDEILVKPPTLKELDKECWQSIERYKVLVWGYYDKEGLQIRSEDGKKDPKHLMFTYNDKKVCPENLRLSIPK